MIFIFNKDLIISLLFLGSAIIITLKEYFQSFLASIISVKEFSLGSYIEVDGVKGKISKVGLLSFYVYLLDKNWKVTNQRTRFPNTILLWNKWIKIFKNNIISESINIKDLSIIDFDYNTIKENIIKIFGKNKITDFEIIDLFSEGKHWLDILWDIDFKNKKGSKEMIFEFIRNNLQNNNEKS